MKDTLTVRVRKSDSCAGEEGRFAEYRVPFEEGLNVLRVINYIYEELDPNLGFMQSCFATYCGTCRVRVNGKDVLACKTLITKREDLVIEPTRLHPVIRDLSVDFEKKAG